MFTTRLLLSLYKIISIKILSYQITSTSYNLIPTFLLYIYIYNSFLHHIEKEMVKFSKELEAQLIPEWKEAFVNYWQLKKQIKRIKLSKIPKQNHNHAEGGGSIFNSLWFHVKKISLKLSPESDHDNTNIIKVLYNLRFFFV